jgi:hypothetical protein
MPPKLWQTIKIGFLVAYKSYISRHPQQLEGNKSRPLYLPCLGLIVIVHRLNV